MKINQEYLKGLLEAFEASDSPTTDIRQLREWGFDYHDNDFIFHLQILNDQHLVEAENSVGLGYERSADRSVCWSVIPLRLTAQGHDFLEALRNSEVWNTIKSEFKEASIGTLLKVSKDLLEGYIKKQIKDKTGY